ncbi:alpha 1,6-mannosyltransferase [Microdochium nivale]|nr:alpha 1,6-mannosyltransferase [Microdochium nivale]
MRSGAMSSSFKRAVIIAVFLLVAFYFLHTSHSSTGVVPPTRPQYATGGSNANANAPDGKAGAGHDMPTVQKVIQDMSKMTLSEKLAYQYPYDVETKFPAFIWQTWKTTPADPDFEFRDQEASWSELHPGFVHEVITDQVAVHLLRMLYASVPEVLEAYHTLPQPVLKADFFRYLILYARGGIYTDIDTYAIQSALSWIPPTVPQTSIGLIVGIEADPDRPDWADWYSRRIQFCQWTIQAKSGHPVLRDIITRITKETLKRQKEGGVFVSKDKSIVEFTGPAVWTDAIFEYFNDPRFFDKSASDGDITYKHFTHMTTAKKVGDVVVLPITSFSPGVQQMGAKEYDDPMAFVKHDFEGTWKPESERHIGESEEDKIAREKEEKERKERKNRKENAGKPKDAVM